MSRVAAVLLALAFTLVACSAGAPAATPAPAASPVPVASATPSSTPTPPLSPLPTIILPVTSTLPPVTLELPATVAPTECAPRADWGGTHVVRTGEALFLIAPVYDLTPRELQLANCIEDANFIQAGQVLRVPGTPEAATPVVTADSSDDSPADSPVEGTATPLIFSADSTVLDAGECTILRWEIENVDAVFFDGTPVSGRGIREVCPQETTRYTLLVLYSNGEQEPFLIVVEVRPA